MAQNEEAASAQAAAAPKSGGGNKLIFIILGMNVLMMVVVLFVVLRKPAGPAPAHAETPAPAEKTEGPAGERGPGTPGAPGTPKPGPILKLENFVIQLRGVDQDRYVRVSFDLEVAADLDREAVQVRLPQIRDSVISYFSDRTLDELRGSEGIERTKVSIMKRMEEIVPGRRVRAIYITDFIIQ
jgi:flagellar FliL protein